MKRFLEIVAIASWVFFYLPTPCRAGNEGSDSKIEELLRKMTLEEKVYQLCAAYFGTGAEVFQESGLITEARELGSDDMKAFCSLALRSF